MLDNVYTPNNSETLETKYLRIDENFQIICAAKGAVSLSNGNNIITFSEAIGTNNYMVLRNVFDASNIPVEHVLFNKTENGFSVSVGFDNCTLNYLVIKL